MRTHGNGPLAAGPHAVDLEDDEGERQEMTAQTAIRLRDLCENTDEDFDGNLSERQALRRIAALEELHPDE